MSTRIFVAQSVSANAHLHIVRQARNGGKPATSAGLANEETLFLHNETGGARDVRVTLAGVWTDASGEAATGLDYSPNASAGVWVTLVSASADFTSTYPMADGDAFRLRHRLGSAAASSVDAFFS